MQILFRSHLPQAVQNLAAPAVLGAMGNWCGNPQDPDELVFETEEWEVDMVVANNWWRGHASPYVCTRCGAEWHRREPS